MSKNIPRTAVLAEREMLNVDTGVDLAVPDFSFEVSTKSDFGSFRSITYKLVVVTDLPIIVQSMKDVKTSENFPADSVIHFVHSRLYDDFYQLRRQLIKLFPTTAVPEIPKKFAFGDMRTSTISATRAEARNRQTSLDNLMKWCASNSEIASSETMLNFIGCSPREKLTLSNKKSSAEKQLLAALKKNASKAQQSEIEEDLFDSVSRGSKTASSVIFEDTLVENSETFYLLSETFAKTKNDGPNLEEEMKIRLFSLSLSNEFQSENKQNTLQNTDGADLQQSEENDEDISDVISRLKVVGTDLKKTRPTEEDKRVFAPADKQDEMSLVDEMADEELLQYIRQNETQEMDLDLGF